MSEFQSGKECVLFTNKGIYCSSTQLKAVSFCPYDYLVRQKPSADKTSIRMGDLYFPLQYFSPTVLLTIIEDLTEMLNIHIATFRATSTTTPSDNKSDTTLTKDNQTPSEQPLIIF